MFYSIIQRKRNEWLSRIDCPVKSLLSYIEGKGMMRDAQIEAIKTYLFLKIECGNKPLWRLFTEGDFLSLNLDNMSLTSKARLVLETNKAAASLYEYACQSDEQGNVSAPALKKYIEDNPDTIDYVAVFKKFFYDVAYPDYIFSLPMGAGKTYLMGCIYNYFKQNGKEPAILYYPEFIRKIKSKISNNSYDLYIDLIRDEEILIIDDIGAENITEFIRDEVLGPIINHREAEKLPTFFSSNLSIDDLAELLSNGRTTVDKTKALRIVERIHSLSASHFLDGENEREYYN